MGILNKVAEVFDRDEAPKTPERLSEQVVVPETSVETGETQKGSERQDERGQEEKVQADASAVIATISSTSEPVAPVKDALAEQIEDVLEEDMTDLFLAMSPADRKTFKEKGEETVLKIRDLLSQATLQTKKIFDLIRSWLSLIPGVNRFFLEQEAKIKTDKIKQLSEDNKNNNSL